MLTLINLPQSNEAYRGDDPPETEMRTSTQGISCRPTPHFFTYNYYYVLRSTPMESTGAISIALTTEWAFSVSLKRVIAMTLRHLGGGYVRDCAR